jgi:hypothetical protein
MKNLALVIVCLVLTACTAPVEMPKARQIELINNCYEHGGLATFSFSGISGRVTGIICKTYQE